MAKVKIDPEGRYGIHFDFSGEELTGLPFTAGELWEATPVFNEEGIFGYYWVSGGAGGWELRDNIRILQDHDDVGDSITVIDLDTDEIIADDWGDLRELGLAE